MLVPSCTGRGSRDPGLVLPGAGHALTSLLWVGDRDRLLVMQNWHFCLWEPSIPVKHPHPCACQASLWSSVAKAGAGEAKGHLSSATASRAIKSRV